MGGDMANVKNSNLKVPPLKIVLSSAASGGSDRSSSTSPSSESESLDSNLTIISENQHQERINKSSEQRKEDSTQSKQDKLAKQTSKGSGGSGGGCNNDQKTTPSGATTVPGNRRSQDNNLETLTNNSNDPAANREQPTSSNQRITRSSQRAAQQNKSESETNGEETNVIETQDTNNKSANELGHRKVKRRKGEVQEGEQDSNQQVPQQPVIMANICPADYQLPAQNSFKLYRDIRNMPYTKLMKLNLVSPRIPHGFRDYLLHSGPYLLDGNKVGLGIGGSRLAISTMSNAQKRTSQTSNLVSDSNNKRPSLPVTSGQPCSSLHPSYIIPKLADTPKHLKLDSPLSELFQDQERARQKMRIQHLKERERSVLSTEQEILRAYNRVAIADTRQTSHLSACTYLYFQERYHYVDEKSNYLDSINQKDSTQGRENSDSCNAENSVTDRLQGDTDAAAPSGKHRPTQSQGCEPDQVPPVSGGASEDKCSPNNDANQSSNNEPSDSKPPAKKRKGEPADGDHDGQAINGSNNGCDMEMDNNNKVAKSLKHGHADGDTRGAGAIETSTINDASSNMCTPDDDSTEKQQGNSDKNASGEPTEVMSDADLRELNKANLINDLNEIDEKWANIRGEMFMRHKNESDSLYAVQCLEWEWKAKEIGACDIRLSPRIDSESVPKVEVPSLDY